MILQNYLWTASEFFSKKDVAEMHRAADLIPEMVGSIGQGNEDDPDSQTTGKTGVEDLTIRSSTVKWIDLEKGQLPMSIWDGIETALNMAKAECNWNWNWEKLQNPQYTVYSANNEKPKGDFYTWHTDAGPIPYDNNNIRKLSMSIQLSEPEEYEGGNFQWLEPNNQFDRLTQQQTTIDIGDSIRTVPFSAKEIGSVIIFPSFLYHQVTPVLTGTRKSLVCWFEGQNYV